MLEIQQVDLLLLEHQKALEQIPAREAEIRAEMEQLSGDSARADAEIREMEKQIRSLEGDVEALRLRQAKLRQQQMAVKTNKEYQAMLGEIDYLSKQVSQQEDQILELMELVDVTRQENEHKKQRLAEGSARLAGEMKRLADSRGFLADELERKRSQREILSAEVPAKVMALYNKLTRGLDGIALAEAREELCMVCHVRLRPQLYQELRTTDDVIQCENCSRILYFVG